MAIKRRFKLAPKARGVCARRHLAIFLLVFCFSASSNSLAATLLGTILGNGVPLDATVRVYGGSVDTSVSTDAAGAYSVSGLSIGVTYSLDITPASPSSLKPLIGYSVAISSENESESFNLIQEYGSFNISGTVQTDEGYPVSTGMRSHRAGWHRLHIEGHPPAYPSVRHQ